MIGHNAKATQPLPLWKSTLCPAIMRARRLTGLIRGILNSVLDELNILRIYERVLCLLSVYGYGP